MVITARFPSQCPRCRQWIVKGESVEWSRATGPATHPNCQQATAAVVALTAPARVSVEEKGVYVMSDGSVVLVKPNLAKTRTYASRWVVIPGLRLTEAGTKEHGEYRFEPGLVQQVAVDGRKMSLEEAKAFVLRFGQCARCCRHLKAAESVERGLGPVCKKYFSAGTTAADLMVVAAPAVAA